MTTSTLDSFAEAAQALTPPAVSQYLAAHDWSLERQDSAKQVWLSAGSGKTATATRLMLPMDPDYADFANRFADALLSLGRVYGWSASDLQEQISSTRADLLFVRLDQSMPDGTIPFRQAERSIDALYKMLRAAATTTADPNHSHLGKRPANVSSFLDDYIRLGHTKRGSFVFTVVVRLDDNYNASAGDTRDDDINFSRRVMETLARGLGTTRELTKTWDPRVLESPGASGVSSKLIESLEELTGTEALRSVGLKFDWSLAVPRPNIDVDTVVFDREAALSLPEIREKLVRREEPPRRETIIGSVRSLTREEDDPDDSESGIVQISAEVDGKVRVVHVPLSGEDHQWAIFAYQRRIPFTVTGDLVYERRAWRLVGNIVVDSEFLEYEVQRRR